MCTTPTRLWPSFSASGMLWQYRTRTKRLSLRAPEREDSSGRELHGTARKEDEEGRLIELNLASTYKMSEDVREEGQRKSSY